MASLILISFLQSRRTIALFGDTDCDISSKQLKVGNEF